MKSKLILSIFVFALAFTQMRTRNAAFGFGADVTLGTHDFGRDDDFGYKVDALLRSAIVGNLEGELHVAFLGNIKRKPAKKNSYATDFATLDYRFLFRLFASKYISPYVSAGIGYTFYINKTLYEVNGNEETSGNVLSLPASFGIQFRLSKKLSLDVHATHTYTNGDNLNNFGTEKGFFKNTDGFTSGGIALIVALGKDAPMPEKKKVVIVNDSDNDGLTDNDEIMTYKTDHKKADTDDDGLSDGDEVNEYKTDPLKRDTDDDGLSDGDEVNNYKTDPNKNADKDSDGISDADEVLKYKTNPSKSDTDDDGLSDSDEISKYKTNPLKSDSDDDGLSDGDEVNKHKTNPLKADSDDGSVNDGREVNRGTNPLNAGDDVIVEIKENAPIVLDGITFDSGKSKIKTSSEATLKKVINTFKAYPDLKVEIKGYTDSSGSYKGNVRLSRKRADAVRTYLIKHGVAADRMVASGLGPENPIADNKTREGRAKNRRIEFSRKK